MVPAIKGWGLREYEPFRDDYGSETAVREKMYCFRHYRRYWRDMGWIGDGGVEMLFTDEEGKGPQEEQTFSDPVENRNEIAG